MSTELLEPDHRGWRLFAGYGAIVATVPYLTLKALWLSGNLLGIPTGSPAASQEFVYANAATAGLDTVVIVLALALTHHWGRRIPAWLLVVPLWVGTGLLVPAALQAGTGGLISVVTGGGALRLEGGLVDPWVYVTVSSSFMMQGLFLTVAFALYARDRWHLLFRPMDGSARRSATHGVQVVLARASAVGAVLIASAYGAWLFSGTGGPLGTFEEGWAATQRSNFVIWGGLALAGAIGILGMTGPRRRMAFPWALVLTWIGSSSMFGWGLYHVTVVLSGMSMAQDLPALGSLTQLVSMLSGLVMGMAGIIRSSECHGGASTGDAARSRYRERCA